jgi:hypothetical protein
VTTTTGTATATATCPAGSSLLGGGGTAAAVNNAGALVFLYQSFPSAADTWTASGRLSRTFGSLALLVQAYAVCTASAP